MLPEKVNQASMVVGRPTQKAPSIRKPSNSAKSSFRGFVHHSEANASSHKAPKASRSLTDIYLDYLELTAKQETAVYNLYAQEKTFSQEFSTENVEDQLTASSILASHQLDFTTRECPGNKWKIRWSIISGKGKEEVCRALYQCSCGYDHTVSGSKKRYNPIPFTGCLAHAEVIYEVQTHRVLLIRGFFDHNEACQAAELFRAPSWPVHPSISRTALCQLQAGLSMNAIMEANRVAVDTHDTRTYPEMPDDILHSRWRWILNKTDSRSLYRQFHRMQDVKVMSKAYINLDEWLDLDSPHFNKTLHNAIFHYAPQTTREERLEACIMTPEMREAAWKYSHQSQVLLDGTFGVCNSKILLFIVMDIDENKKGVPLAFLLFSAPSGNKHTAAGYNIESMGSRNGEEFTVSVAITDMDLMERGALVRVFPNIHLLICRVYLRHSWRNHRAKSVKGDTTDHSIIRARLKRLEDSLLETETHGAALQLVAEERQWLENSRDAKAGTNSPTYQAAQGGLAHLEYLETYWLRAALWESWSKHGLHTAAAILKHPVDGVIPTTNHLESFNNVLKNRFLHRHQKGGRRLRIDVLVNILVFHVLPSVFRQRRLDAQEAARREAIMRTLPGGQALIQARQFASSAAPLEPLAYYVPDEAREHAAGQLVIGQQISVPSLDETSKALTFQCYSALATQGEINPVEYTVSLGLDGYSSCTCPDFSKRGGFCKHMRAAILRGILLNKSGVRLPFVHIPKTVEEALEIRAKRRILSIPITAPAPTLPPALPAAPLNDAVCTINELLHDAEDVIKESRLTGSRTADIEEANSSTSDDSDQDGVSIPQDDINATSSEFDASETGFSREPSIATTAELDDKFDIAAVRSARANTKGIDEQTIGRTLMDLERVAPKLSRLAPLLHPLHLDRANHDDINRFVDVWTSMEPMLVEISRLLTEVGALPNGTGPAAHSLSLLKKCPGTPPPSKSGFSKCPKKVPALGPSPEKAQKRKESYSHH
ncbi:uncharacterized protein PHACADRAFT_27236 [Phanerochaete carnosa HHB-10118-sp]|uniref:SWIM-type domain-containing protein n=1 Tax=Phanerochaete carnosa (strain HHB-10118-sp) TaxID=650164 RepID=K5WAZ0_PHACS|nr:uncharacterized protein PHACADRAFT_27236 [Phanerochaete carnosa HHB-10118-sp]EKM56355.1 hypothetical protein PHACADRAFT_27236 [Phanerochaete carnosa HHB-10118-sp]